MSWEREMQEACCTWPKCETEADRLREINADLVAHLAFAVKILDGIPAIAGTAQVDAMRSALSKAKES